MRIALIAAAVGACMTFSVNAQTPGASPAAANYCGKYTGEQQAKCVKFVETCRWHEGRGMYVNRSDGKACGSVMTDAPTRDQIKAERDKFIANNKWDEGKGMWVPLSKPRPVDTSRADVKADAQAFTKTHQWHEGKGMYVPVK